MDLTPETITAMMENDCQPAEGESVESLTQPLIQKLGSPVSDSREGALEIIYTWIIEGNYDNAALLQLGDQFCALLQTDLGSLGTDAAFLRAFVALELGAILKFDNSCAEGKVEGRTAFLDHEQVGKWLDKAVQYYRSEKDYRGFVPGKGWAHSIAHGADLFRDFGKHRLIQKQDLDRIFRLLLGRAFAPAPQLMTGKEQYRIATAFYTALLQDKFSSEELDALFEEFLEGYKNRGWVTVANDPEALHGYLNGEHFIHALYFMVKFGISRKGSRSIPYYDSPMPHREKLLAKMEEAIAILDNGSFYQYSP